VRDGKERIISPGHEDVGVDIAAKFLERINAPQAIVERVAPLIRNHMSHMIPITDRSVRRLAKRLEPENIEGLSIIMTADSMGRPPKPARVPEFVIELQLKAAELNVEESAAKPILMGRHLLDLGMSPGPAFKEILDAAYEAQLEGSFHDLDGALRWLRERK
jgi:tRNA nucleotidyltransferase (CCA-adding enzyme)